MNFQDENPELTHKKAFSYREKGSMARFMAVYFFFLRKSIVFWYHYKLSKLLLSPENAIKKEDKLFHKLGMDCRELFLNLGGVYIKLGQFLSSLSHIFPLSFIEALKDLQDRIPPHPFEELKERFEKEFQKKIEDVFPDIDPTPLAAASTAQVHTATLFHKKVVVKILYPHIEKIVEKDLATILFVMKRIDRYFINYDYKTIHREVSEIITREMNLLEEGKSIQRMAELFKEEKDYVFPYVYTTFTSKGVLATEFIEGVKITQVAKIKRKNQKKSRPLELLLKAYILMIFKFRFFHADPHPGNLIYTKEGKLCFIDFGAVAELPGDTVLALRKILESAIKKDYFLFIEGMEQMGFFEPDADKEKLERVARFALEKLENFVRSTDSFANLSLEQLKPEEVFVFLEGINSSLSELLKATQVPNNYVMLERTLALLMGITAAIDPTRTVFEYADPYFHKIVVEKISVVQLIEKEGNEIAITALTLPSELQKTLLTINRERLTIRNADTERQTTRQYILGHQFIYTIFTLAGIHFGNFYLQNEFVEAAYVSYVTGAIFAISLFRSFIKNRLGKL